MQAINKLGSKLGNKLGKCSVVVTVLLAYLLAACVAPSSQTAGTQQAAAGTQQTASTQQTTALPVTEENLVGPTWQWLVWLKTSPANPLPVSEPEKYTVNFLANGLVKIQADCNQITGNYIARNGSLLIELGPSTMAYCGEQSLDRQYLALLTQVVGGALVNEQLSLTLDASAGFLGFQPGNGAGSEVGIAPQDIHLDTQGLPYSWQANVVAATPYDASQAPGPQGLPEHIEINFGDIISSTHSPADKQP